MKMLHLLSALLLCAGMLLAAEPCAARDAAFVEPGTASGKGTNADGLIADPKNFDAGESTVGVMRRVSLFFVNTGSASLTIGELVATGDGNVKVETESSDCKSDNKIAGFSRCTVALAISPTSAGAWSVEILAKHDGVGRIARAVVTGRAINDAKSATRGEGLNLSSRDMKPIDFADVEVGGAAAVRTALMVNDSPETLIIKAIDLIAVDEGLERLTTGCSVDQELKPDSSCPITLKWHPHGKGNIATDLIMRHTGKIGFTVIPVRGHATGDGALQGFAAQASSTNGAMANPAKMPPPTAEDLESITGKLPPNVLTEAQVQRTDLGSKGHATTSGVKLYLIGAVGRRAILQRDGVTKTLSVGDEIEFGNNNVKLLSLVNREARVMVNGVQQALQLGASGFRPPSSSSGNKDASKSTTSSSISQSSSGK
jgi:hypothetical protein